MKIEIDLTKIDDYPDAARVACVAVLTALPVGEAELAVGQWRALTGTGEHTAPVDEATLMAQYEAQLAPPEKPKRKRRTKAEMEAARAAEESAALAEPVADEDHPTPATAAGTTAAATACEDDEDDAESTEDLFQAALPLRELLRHAENQIGRPRVIELMQAQGVTKISEVTDEVPIRAAIAEALAA